MGTSTVDIDEIRKSHVNKLSDDKNSALRTWLRYGEQRNYRAQQFISNRFDRSVDAVEVVLFTTNSH